MCLGLFLARTQQFATGINDTCPLRLLLNHWGTLRCGSNTALWSVELRALERGAVTCGKASIPHTELSTHTHHTEYIRDGQI